MAHAMFSPGWAKAFKDEINSSDRYRDAAKGWKWSVGLVVEAEPDKGVPEARGIVLDLMEGEARKVLIGDAAAAQKCEFVLTAPYSRWKEVAEGRMDATRALLMGRLKLKGDLPTIVRYTKSAQELTLCIGRVDTAWPDA